MNFLTEEDLLEIGLDAHSDSPDFKSFSNEENLAGGKYVTFFLADKFFAVAAEQVAEVVQMPHLTPLPKTPEWLLGIANLRGEIIAVVNLPKLWNEKAASASSKSKLILLRSADNSVAFAVDRLSEVITLKKKEIQFVDAGNIPHLLGKATHSFGVLHLLDAEKICSGLRL